MQDPFGGKRFESLSGFAIDKEAFQYSIDLLDLLKKHFTKKLRQKMM